MRNSNSGLNKQSQMNKSLCFPWLATTGQVKLSAKDKLTNFLTKMFQRLLYMCGCVFMTVCLPTWKIYRLFEWKWECSIIHEAVCRTLLPKNMFYESPINGGVGYFHAAIYFTDLTNCRHKSILHLGFMLGCLVYSLNFENIEKRPREY